jgi:hypothetical protein
MHNAADGIAKYTIQLAGSRLQFIGFVTECGAR